ncbi:MAG: hypothetical protein PHX08_07810 [Lachnospiraceae bacterium]|nr:hypothetical protein [Lachnospiraceae bacterium]
MQAIDFYCKRCNKSLHMSYEITGNDNAPVLPNVIIKCTHCKRALFLRNYTEKKLLEGSVNGKFYI